MAAREERQATLIIVMEYGRRCMTGRRAQRTLAISFTYLVLALVKCSGRADCMVYSADTQDLVGRTCSTLVIRIHYYDAP